MKDQFVKHISKNNLFTHQSKLLLGISGGKDSMVLADLLLKNDFKFSVAHCNFKLRGDEANEDESFVNSYFKAKNIKVFSTSFNTRDCADANDISIQMAARDLRYKWFNKIREENNFDLILTAHTSTDNVETFFINLLRGTGLKGLKGIPEKNNFIVRPLLPFSREAVDKYVIENSIPYREDSSNAEVKYLRNKIRKQLMPLLKEINPSIEHTLNTEMAILKESFRLQEHFIKHELEKISSNKNEQLFISIEGLLASEFSGLLLHELLSNHEFAGETVANVLECMKARHPGKIFYSKSHQLVIDRTHLIVQKINEQYLKEEFLIPKNTLAITKPIGLQLTEKEGAVIIPSEHIACLDASKTIFPLTLRKWKEGDSFVPMGMNGKKKLSDFFVSEKMNHFEKKEQWLLCSGSDIVWIIGKRIDDRFKVNDFTSKTLIIELSQ